jgi:phosphoglycerate dehydrogenase-like enzyme
VTVPVAVAPTDVRSWVIDAVVDGGGAVVDAADAEAIVWTAHDDPAGLGALLDEHPTLRWVQLPWAGVEPYADVIAAHGDRVWTSGKGVYAEPVAELALTLLLAGFRGLDSYARATTWEGPTGRNLLGARVVVAGAGGITESLVRLLAPFDCDITIVRRRPTLAPLAGAARVVGADELDGALDSADALVLALALTPSTVGMIDRRRLSLLGDGAWLVNVARGRHVVTDDLVDELRAGSLGGAGLDVTDPEPLPDGHPLWRFPNVLITPHVGNTPQMAVPLLSARIAANVHRWASGEDLLGPVDPAAGY